MVHISKRDILPEVHKKIAMQLATVLHGTSSQQTTVLLNDLMGAEEQLVLAKRLAAILLITQGATHGEVSETLAMSRSTVTLLVKKIDGGSYHKTIALIKKDPIRFTDLLDALDSILHLGGILPHYGQTHKSEEYKRNMRAKMKKRSVR